MLECSFFRIRHFSSSFPDFLSSSSLTRFLFLGFFKSEIRLTESSSTYWTFIFGEGNDDDFSSWEEEEEVLGMPSWMMSSSSSAEETSVETEDCSTPNLPFFPFFDVFFPFEGDPRTHDDRER